MENSQYFSKNDIAQMEQRYRANFINSLSGYKSAFLVATKGEQNSNLAIFNSIFHLGANPSLLGMVSRPNSVPRHTLENMRAHQYFTLNHVETSFLKQAHQTSARYERDQSEFMATGLAEEYLAEFSAPFVKQAQFKLGMKYVREIYVPENETIIVIAEVEQVHIDKKLIQADGYIDLSTLPLVVAASLDGYAKAEFIQRLPYAKA
jgi:flavin reductase (DIM6/NTAB) family NADH-FMN oxidoreductase RutF